MEKKYPWFKVRDQQLLPEAEQLVRSFTADISRRNKTPNLELYPWFDRGPEILRELDAEERLLKLKNAPRDSFADLRSAPWHVRRAFTGFLCCAKYIGALQL